jgi:putative ABC transport system ATP-binding protein
MELHNRKTNNGRGSGGGPLIKLRRVGKSYATPAGLYPALRDIDLEIGAGEFVALVGKSGSGKTTLLNLIRVKLS